MKNNNTAIFESSARRTLHFAVTSRWPGTPDSRAHEFMTPSWDKATTTKNENEKDDRKYRRRVFVG